VKDLEVEIENMGGSLNAYTGREQTCYYAKVRQQQHHHQQQHEHQAPAVTAATWRQQQQQRHSKGNKRRQQTDGDQEAHQLVRASRPPIHDGRQHAAAVFGVDHG
jgi:hypothetical protein